MRKKPVSENKHQIGNLLSRYKERLKPPQASVEKAFVASVKAVTGLSITEDKVTYSVASKTISLSVSAMIKSELKLQQSEIEAHLKKELPADRVPTVIF